MKKSDFIIFTSVMLILILTPAVKANFACGQVLSKNPQLITSSWLNVKIYYSDAPQSFATCKVSPAENKFCCDTRQIEGQEWRIGRAVEAKIINNKYFTNKANLTISGEGFDIFPLMTMQKAIIIHSPSSGIYVNITKLFVNLSTFGGYDNISYNLSKDEEIIKEKQICDNCNNSEFYLENLTLGSYVLNIFAQNQERETKNENVTFSIVDDISFDRKIECNGCLNREVPANKNVTIKLSADFSHNVKGKIKDFFPVEWKLIENKEGKVHSFSPTHNYIEWEIDEKESEFEYTILSPSTIIAKKYEFKTLLENYTLEKSDMTLYRFYKFFPLKQKQHDLQIEPFIEIKYLQISKENPLIININNEKVELIALFPKENTQDIEAKIYSLPINKNEFLRIKIESDIEQDNLDRVLIRFKIKKNEAVKNTEIYLQNNYGSIKLLEKTLYQEDSEYFYYDAFSDEGGEFFAVYENE